MQMRTTGGATIRQPPQGFAPIPVMWRREYSDRGNNPVLVSRPRLSAMVVVGAVSRCMHERELSCMLGTPMHAVIGIKNYYRWRGRAPIASDHVMICRSACAGGSSRGVWLANGGVPIPNETIDSQSGSDLN